MKKFLAMALAGLATLAAGAASMACVLILIEEPEMPKSLVEK